MKSLGVQLTACFFCASAWAVYAPIPETSKGRALSAVIEGGVYHDSNIFGGAENEIDSIVYRIAPSVTFNSSLTDQTFLSAGYHLTVDYIEERPGDRDLISHALNSRLSHTFSPRSAVELSAAYQIARNPESLLAGVPLNTDQSFESSQFDGQWTVNASPRLGFTFKGRTIDFGYDNATLARALDRRENLGGASANFLLQPRLKLTSEYRYQTIEYESSGALKDKQSHFVLGGFDYAAGPKLTVNARLGAELREREGAADEDAPYAEVTARYAYGERSFIGGGYILTFEEASNVTLYTDSKVNRLYVNAQHALRPTLIASGYWSYEPSTLQGRPSISPDRDETTTRLGLALTYLARRHWSVSATLDLDRVESDDLSRDYGRTRVGLGGRYVF
jgi:hypothetical protein